jgi:hypothetical protein
VRGYASALVRKIGAPSVYIRIFSRIKFAFMAHQFALYMAHEEKISKNSYFCVYGALIFILRPEVRFTHLGLQIFQGA